MRRRSMDIPSSRPGPSLPASQASRSLMEEERRSQRRHPAGEYAADLAGGDPPPPPILARSSGRGHSATRPSVPSPSPVRGRHPRSPQPRHDGDAGGGRRRAGHSRFAQQRRAQPRHPTGEPAADVVDGHQDGAAAHRRRTWISATGDGGATTKDRPQSHARRSDAASDGVRLANALRMAARPAPTSTSMTTTISAGTATALADGTPGPWRRSSGPSLDQATELNDPQARPRRRAGTPRAQPPSSTGSPGDPLGPTQ
jgi:hypothetical protein